MGILSVLKTYQLIVNSSEKVGQDSWMIRFEKPENFVWLPASYGQFILPGIKEAKEAMRQLTLASNPDEDFLTILFRIGENTSPYKEALTKLPKGSTVHLKWVYSNLKVKPDHFPLIIFASDVGIAAARPIVMDSIGTDRDIFIYHLDKGCLAFEKELQDVSSQVDRISYEKLASFDDMNPIIESFPDQSASYILVGGREEVKTVARKLKEAGVEGSRIQREVFKGI